MSKRLRTLSVGSVGLLAMLAGLSGCGRDGPHYVAHFRRDTRVSFAECGDSACLESSERACRPAHLADSFTTIEGQPVWTDTFVLPNGDGGCEVVKFADHSQNSWGACRVYQDTCPNIAAMRSDNKASLGCSQIVMSERWWCKNPLSRF